MARNRGGSVKGSTIVIAILALAVLVMGAMYFSGSMAPASYKASSGEPVNVGGTNIVVNTADKGLTPAEAQAQAKTGDLVINLYKSSGAAFADTLYKFYPVSADYAKATTLDTKYALNYIYDSPGVAALLTPDGMQAPALAVSSGKVTLDDYNGKPLILYGYPATYGVSNAEPIAVSVVPTKLTGLDTPVWGYTIDGVTTTNLQIYNLSTLHWANPQDKTVESLWTDYKASATPGQSMTVKLNATAVGEMTRDMAIFLETPDNTAVTRVDITDMDSGKSVTYESGDFEATQYASGWKSKSSPALNESTSTMWLVGLAPDDNLYKSLTYSNGYQVTVYYDHPGSNNYLCELWAVENVRSTTTTSGHKDSPTTKLHMNLTAGSDATTGFSLV